MEDSTRRKELKGNEKVGHNESQIDKSIRKKKNWNILEDQMALQVIFFLSFFRLEVNLIFTHINGMLRNRFCSSSREWKDKDRKVESRISV